MKRRALGKGLSSLIPDPPEKGAAGQGKEARSLESIETERSPGWPSPDINTGAGAPAPQGRVPVTGARITGDVTATGESDLAASGDHVRVIDMTAITPNPKQPRQRIPPEQLEELATSIRNTGILQPILVRAHGNGYQLIAGERRFRAAKLAGLDSIPAIVREIPDTELLEVALVENIQRQELNPIEEARAYLALQREREASQADIADRVGKQRSTVANTIRLLNLPRPVQDLLETGAITSGHARALLGILDPDAQLRLARDITEKKLNVRDVEELVRRENAKKSAADTSKNEIETKDPNVAAAETKLARKLATKVTITQNRKGAGKLVIEFYSAEELDRLFETILRGTR